MWGEVLIFSSYLLWGLCHDEWGLGGAGLTRRSGPMQLLVLQRGGVIPVSSHGGIVCQKTTATPALQLTGVKQLQRGGGASPTWRLIGSTSFTEDQAKLDLFFIHSCRILRWHKQMFRTDWGVNPSFWVYTPSHAAFTSSRNPLGWGGAAAWLLKASVIFGFRVNLPSELGLGRLCCFNGLFQSRAPPHNSLSVVGLTDALKNNKEALSWLAGTRFFSAVVQSAPACWFLLIMVWTAPACFHALCVSVCVRAHVRVWIFQSFL